MFVCELCHVTSHTEGAHKEHLGGRKHIASERLAKSKCRSCGVQCGTPESLANHTRHCDSDASASSSRAGARAEPSHRRRARTPRFFCSPCQRAFTSNAALQQHLAKSNKHQARAGTHHCADCSRSFDSAPALAQHMRSASHVRKAKAASMKRETPQVVGLRILNVTPAQVEQGQQHEVEVTVENSKPNGPGIWVRKIQGFELKSQKSVAKFKLRPGEQKRVSIGSVCGNELGLLPVPIKLIVGLERRNLLVEHSIHVLSSLADADELKPDAPYRPRRLREKRTEKTLVGERPKFHDGPDYQVQLPYFQLPAKLRTMSSEELRDELQLALPLDYARYAAQMDALLFVEEMAMIEDLRRFNIEGATFTPRGMVLEIHVGPGLAERRPSVLYGDDVVTQFARPGKGSANTYKGSVWFVGLDHIHVRFHDKLHAMYSGQPMNVFFKLNRTQLRREHFALTPERLPPQSTLFPTVEDTVAGLPEEQLLVSFGEGELYNRDLNLEQQRAVLSIMRGDRALPPFVLMGPPGTGKTTTLVEAVLQLQRQGHRILICAPSNAAADVIAERLAVHMSNKDLVRLSAYSRVPSQVSETVRQYSPMRGGHFTLPGADKIVKFSVVVSTCGTGCKMFSLGVPSNHFSFICIDEAGFVTEPAAVAVLASMMEAAGGARVVLAGDPKQLGPVIFSSLAREFELNKSLQARLMERPLYARQPDRFAHSGGYDPNVIVKLVRNYRSHGLILKVPSQLFYEDELKPCAPLSLRNGLLDWAGLPNRRAPLLFHGLQGKETRESHSPSWFNVDEVLAVDAHVASLIAHGLQQEEIGVITPYHKQSKKIAKLLKKHGFEEVKVGSVELFQGDERRAIIISTVRSSDEYLDFDKEHNIGFVGDSQRFNVALTRAQSLLVVVGNPHVLQTDPNWGTFLRHCSEHKAYRGCAFELDEVQDDEAAGAFGGYVDTVEEWFWTQEEVSDIESDGSSAELEE